MGGKVTLTVIKADIGAIGGHTKPSEGVLRTVGDYAREQGAKYGVRDMRVGHFGDDIYLLMSHEAGVAHPDIHINTAYNAFRAGTEVAQREGLYAAGQDLLVDAPSGNVRGAGPGVAEMEFEERPTAAINANEAFAMVVADKTEPGAFNQPLFQTFCNPMTNSALLLTGMREGFVFRIRDVGTPKGGLAEFRSPTELYDIALLLRDTNHYAVDSIWTPSGLQVVSASTDRLHNISGKYSGKDDPAMLVRTQKPFPATEELGIQFASIPYVDGDCRGSHRMPLMPVPINTPASGAYCNPIVSMLVFSMRDGKLSAPVDEFANPFWEPVRHDAVRKALEMRRQGFFGPAMVSTEEIEYSAAGERLQELEKRFEA